MLLFKNLLQPILIKLIKNSDWKIVCVHYNDKRQSVIKDQSCSQDRWITFSHAHKTH